MSARRRQILVPPRQDSQNRGEQKETEGGKITKTKKSNKFSSENEKKTFVSRCVSALKYIFLLVIIPPFINYASLQREYSQLKPPEGELYDIGWGQKLFMMCQGKGPPTVILDAPTGMTSDVWTLVWPQLAKHARVCLYDRAGLGYSERPYINSSAAEEDKNSEYSNRQFDWKPYTVERMVDDVNRVFTASSQQPQPFIFVGAELGAMISLFYTQMYEDQVFGVVLVNPLSTNLFEQDQGSWAQYWFGQLIPTYQSFQLGAALGVTRLALMVGILKHPLSGVQLSPDVEARQKYLLCNPRHLSTVVDEHHFINESFSQIRTMQKFRSVPQNISVTVITGNYYDEQIPNHLNKAWAKSEQSLISTYLPQAKHIVVNGADHHMLYKDPVAVADPVVRMIKLYKSKHKKS